VSLVLSLMVLVLVSVTTFYAFGSFDPEGIMSSNETGIAPGGTGMNETGIAPGGTGMNETGIAPGGTGMNETGSNNEKKS